MDEENLLHWLICSGYSDIAQSKRPCGKKLLLHNITEGGIEIKCHRCGTTNEYYTTLGETNEPI